MDEDIKRSKRKLLAHIRKLEKGLQKAADAGCGGLPTPGAIKGCGMCGSCIASATLGLKMEKAK